MYLEKPKSLRLSDKHLNTYIMDLYNKYEKNGCIFKIN